MATISQPVVAIVGHIDHGKTTLLDYIRKSAVAEKEIGGITQRISAYEVTHKGAEGDRLITFIDTPGHEAFQKMRRRAGSAADIAILIVASDDGVKPQTIEAYKAIQEAKIPFIVAFTKIDKDTSNLDRAKESVMKEGIYLEGLGGDIPYAGVSGKTGDGVPELLDLILLASDLHTITCDSLKPAEGVVLESSRDPRSGTSATIILRQGTLKTGEFIVAGGAYAPLRAIENFVGVKVNEIQCGKPFRITGFTGEPPVGSLISVVKTKKDAEDLAKSQTQKDVARGSKSENEEVLTARVVLKADSMGSLEALEYELSKIAIQNMEVLVISKSVGAVTENDIKPLIGFSPAIVLGFNVKPDATVKDLAERQHILLETRSIIYELADWLKAKLTELAPEIEADSTAEVQILKHFSTQGSKQVVGGKVIMGMLKVGEKVLIMRRGIEVGPGKVVNLQMQRSDVNSVPEGMEFGAQIETKGDVIAGDTLIAGKRVKNA